MDSKDLILRKIVTCATVCLLGIAAITTHGQTAAARTNGPSERDWWKNAVIYEVYPRSFQDTNGTLVQHKMSLKADFDSNTR